MNLARQANGMTYDNKSDYCFPFPFSVNDRMIIVGASTKVASLKLKVNDVTNVDGAA